MPQKTAVIPGIGEIIIAKRRGSSNIRLSVSASGRVRVGLPSWLPYAAGIEFAASRRDWISQQLAKHHDHQLEDGGRIGKSYRLKYVRDQAATIPSARVSGRTVNIRAAQPISSLQVQAAAKKAGERALKKEAELLLPVRLKELAARHGFDYQSVKIKRLSSRWGSCSSQKDITLNYFLMQLPWKLIDHVILHELVLTRHMDHSPDFWRSFDEIVPGAKKQRSELRGYRPVINTLL
jgi:predicted metal-dependent hydrolase